MISRSLRVYLATVAMIACVVTGARDTDVGTATNEGGVSGASEEEQGVVVGAPTDRVNDNVHEVIDEVTVTERRLKRFQLPDVEFLVDTYGGRGTGSKLYHEGKFKEAFPYLLEAAKHGFKVAQARTGYLYLTGLGGTNDTKAAIAWIGLAARGRTHPEIRNYWRSLEAQIPASLLAESNYLIDDYNARYGALVNRVGCTFSTTTKSRIKKLYCRYMDQCRYWYASSKVPELSDCPPR